MPPKGGHMFFKQLCFYMGALKGNVIIISQLFSKHNISADYYGFRFCHYYKLFSYLQGFLVYMLSRDESIPINLKIIISPGANDLF